LQAKCILELRDAVGGVSMHVRPKKTQHLPAFNLKLVGLPCVMSALAQAEMKF